MFRKNLPSIVRLFGRLPTQRSTLKYNLSIFRMCMVEDHLLFENYRSPTTANCRSFAKGREIKKVKKSRSSISEHELGEAFDSDLLFREMSKPVDSLKAYLAENITLRTSQGVIENMKVVYENEVYYLQDLAEVTKKSPKLYVLDFEGCPQALQTVYTTLQESELNLNPQQEGTKIFIPVPRVTKEHREILAKKCKSSFLNCRDSIRNVQLRYIKKLKCNDKLSEDVKTSLRSQLTVLADKHIKKAEEIMKSKQNDLLKND